MQLRLRALALALTALAPAAALAASNATGMGSAVARTPASIEPPLAFAIAGSPTRSIALAPADATSLSALRSARAEAKPGQPLRIGFARAVAANDALFDGASAQWVPVPGGFAAKLEVRSPAAQGVRAGVVFEGPRAGVTLRFAGSGRPNELHEFAATEATQRGVNWGPLVEGDSLTLEVFVAEGTLPQAVRLSIAQVMHVDTFPTAPTLRNPRDVGRADSCIPDVACKANPSAEFTALARSVAKISFVTNQGESLCSGTLVNSNAVPKAPYFVTANHCISTQTVASTVTSYWFFDATGCNTDRVGNYIALQGGADLVFNNRGFDHTLLRLRRAVPSGVTYAGWTPLPVATRTPILGIHHPSGDLKKFSEGAKTADVSNQIGLSGPFHQVVWSLGVTEGGSSGSGLFVLDSDARDYRLVGQLLGGGSFCNRQSAPDVYGRFQDVYASVRGVLDSPAPTMGVVSAASYKAGPIAPAQLLSGFAADLPKATYTAQSGCPTELGGRYSVDVRYSSANGQPITTKACLLYVGAQQVNFVLPEGVSGARATVAVIDRLQNRTLGQAAEIEVGLVSPGLFTANAQGTGVPAANVLRVLANGQQRVEPVPTGTNSGLVIDDPRESVFLILYGTGIRNRAAQGDVTVTVAGLPGAVEFAAAQGDFFGLDQINVRLPVEQLRAQNVRGRAIVELKVSTAGGAVLAANPVDLYIR